MYPVGQRTSLTSSTRPLDLLGYVVQHSNLGVLKQQFSWTLTHLGALFCSNPASGCGYPAASKFGTPPTGRSLFMGSPRQLGSSPGLQVSRAPASTSFVSFFISSSLETTKHTPCRTAQSRVRARARRCAWTAKRCPSSRPIRDPGLGLMMGLG